MLRRIALVLALSSLLVLVFGPWALATECVEILNWKQCL